MNMVRSPVKQNGYIINKKNYIANTVNNFHDFRYSVEAYKSVLSSVLTASNITEKSPRY